MSTVPTGEVVLAVDIGGTKVDAALVASDGSVREHSRHRAPTGKGATREALLSSLDAVIQSTLDTLSPEDTLVGAGIGSAGPISLIDNSVSPLNLPVLRNFLLRDFIQQRADVPTSLRLDGTCIALAENWLGSTKGAVNALSMVVSTGVGGGLILNGRLLSGDTGNAGHIGQIQVSSRQSGSSSESASLEHLASGPRVVAWAQRQGWKGTSGEDLARDYAAGVPVALDAVRRSTTAVGEAITSVATLLDVHQVSIGGGFAHVAPDYIDLVMATIAECAIVDYARSVIVARSGLSDNGPLIGAAALIHRQDLL
jgi:glucokinase